MASFRVIASEGLKVPSSSTKLKQRSLFDSFSLSKKPEKDSRDKTSAVDQTMLEIFGSSSASEERDIEIDTSEADNLEADVEALGLPSENCLSDGSAQTKYDALKKALGKMGLEMQRMVGITTDGDSSMLGCHEGLVAKLRREIPHLVATHCIAHREALTILDAVKSFPCLSYIDKIANKIYSWIHGSNVRHAGFQTLLKEMNVQVLEVLQIHDVRWLSRGNVMERLVMLMPGILTYWQQAAPAWYNKLRIYKVLFIIHLLADVLHDLNILSKHFQEDGVEIASISVHIEVSLSSLRRKFLEEDFGKGTKYLKQFMIDTQNETWNFVNESGIEYTHTLLYESIPGKDKDGEPIDAADGDVNSCKHLAICFVETLIDCINERFPDVYFLNAAKLFCPQYYPKDPKRSKSSTEREKKVT